MPKVVSNFLLTPGVEAHQLSAEGGISNVIDTATRTAFDLLERVLHPTNPIEGPIMRLMSSAGSGSRA